MKRRRNRETVQEIMDRVGRRRQNSCTNRGAFGRLLHVFVCLCVLCATVLTTPQQTVWAATSAQKVVSRTVSSSTFKKVSSSVKKTVLSTAQSDQYAAQLAGTTDGWTDTPLYLLITKDGKSYKKISLESTVRSKLSLSDSQYVFFYNLTCIDDVFYVTGGICDDEYGYGTATPFYLKTTSGSSVTVKKTSMNLNPDLMLSLNWNLYYANGYYVAANNYMIFNGTTPYYYISKDLKTWTKKKLTATISLDEDSMTEWRTVTWRVVGASDKGLVFEEGAWYMFVGGETSIPVDYSHFLYTTDFKTYKKVSTLNSNIVTSGTYESGSNTTVTPWTSDSGRSYAVAYVSDYTGIDDDYYNSSSKSLKLLRSSGINSYKTLVNFTKKWNYYAWYTTSVDSSGKTSGVCMYIDTDSQNYVYITSSFTGSATKYTTSLSAEKMSGSGVICDGWSYSVYDGQYILMTKNNGKTVYKIKTGLSNITSLTGVGDNLVLNISGGYDYYIPFSTMETAATATISKTTASVYVGKTTTLKISGTSKTVTWSSSDKSIATVSSKGKVTAKKAGTVTIKAKVGGMTYSCKVTVKDPYLSKTTATIYKGKKLTLKLTGATIKSASSSKTSVATVSSKGVITAKKAGTATITVKDTNGNKYTCKVTVKNPYLSKTSATLIKGATLTLKLNGATIKSASSSKTSVATVSSEGVVTAKKTGSATITIKDTNGNKYTCKVTVKVGTLSATTASINVGSTKTLTLSDVNVSSVSSSDTSVATVSKTSSTKVKISAKKAGTATITVKDKYGNKYTCKVTVKNVAVTGVKLNKSSLTLDIGGTSTLTTTISPSNATNQNVTWSSSDTSVATVSSSGEITAVAAGTAVITVTAADGSGQYAECTVTVKEPVE